ncbi:MAG: 2-dehydro-3-deoxygalactonokinase [Novosphingobium sp.]
MSGWRILADWGSTRLRLWRMTGETVAERADGPGIGGLADTPTEALRSAIAPWLAEHGAPDRIILCGMAGARNGLREVAYVDCPASLAEWRCAATRLDFDGIPLVIAAGCASETDVMRGEETQIFGALALNPALSQGCQTVLHPGTHSKWVWLQDGQITGLRSFMTGELFALMQSSSLFAIGGVGAVSAADQAEGFAAGLATARDTPGVLGSLFQARVVQLRQGRTAAWARGLLSGLLIGGEVAEMRAEGRLSGGVTLIGETALTDRYAKALSAFGATLGGADTRQSGDACALAGLELLDADN